MSEEKPQKQLLGSMQELFKRFETGGDLAPIDDRYEYERQMASLPPEEKEYAEEATRMADLLQYCSQQRLRIPAAITEGACELPELSVAERIARVRELNLALMEHIHNAGQDPPVRN
jgi:hypothetical protein